MLNSEGGNGCCTGFTIAVPTHPLPTEDGVENRELRTVRKNPHVVVVPQSSANELVNAINAEMMKSEDKQVSLTNLRHKSPASTHWSSCRDPPVDNCCGGEQTVNTKVYYGTPSGKEQA